MIKLEFVPVSPMKLINVLNNFIQIFESGGESPFSQDSQTGRGTKVKNWC